MLIPKIVAALLFGIWLVLVLVGKGGLVHILLMSSIGVIVVEIIAGYRARMVR